MAEKAWRVYTVEDHPGGGWAVICTRWTSEGPTDEKRCVSVIRDVITREEAEAEAATHQANYDKLRRAMAS